MKRVDKFVLIFLVIVLTSFFVGATVNVENSSLISTDYRVGEKLQGVLNISVSNEKINEGLKFTFNSEEKLIPLKDFFDAHNKTLYSCEPTNCENDFSVSGSAETSKEIPLTSGKSETIGFVLNGDDLEVLEDGFSFDVSSDAGSNCVSQLSVDVSADGDIEWENNKKLGESCGGDKTSTCYNANSFDSWFLLGQEPYCEKIKIGKAPAFDVKALMKSKEGASFEGKPLVASIYDSTGELKGNCDLSKPTTSGSEESCSIDYVSKSTENHFVCISLKEGSSNEGYSLKARDTGNFCGFKGDPKQVSSTSADYSIKVSPRKYDAVGSFNLNDEAVLSQTGSPLIAEVNDFISERYGKNCPDAGCIIPVMFSGIGQKIIINNINIKYKHSASNEISRDQLYKLSTTPATLKTANSVVVNLDENEISLPSNPGNYSFKLFFKGEKLLEKNITVREKEITIIEQIHPKTVAAVIPNTFLVFVDGKVNVSELKFEWTFSDGSLKQTSEKPFVVHALPTIGNYTLKVKALKQSKEISSAEFKIEAKAPIEAVNETIALYKERIKNVKAKKSVLSTTYQGYIDGIVNLNDIESNINSIETHYLVLTKETTQDDSAYAEMMQELFDEKVPVDIKPSSTEEVQLIYDLNDLVLDDFNYLFKEVYSVSQEDEYKDAIFTWFIENVDVEVKQKTYALYYDDYKQSFVSEFEVKIHPNIPSDKGGYLVIERDVSDLKFENGVVPAAHNGVSGVEVDLSKDSTIKFSLEEDVDSFSLPMFFAPEFSMLQVSQGSTKTNTGGIGFWPKFLIGFFIVAIIVLFLYILLQRWYKSKYEKYLFKNQNDLYNLLQFIRNSKVNKMKDEEIIEKLVKAKWKREQVHYALNKYEGKRVGMWEIPLFTRFEKRKIERELDKRKRIAKL